jgi:hypothetical protein
MVATHIGRVKVYATVDAMTLLPLVNELENLIHPSPFPQRIARRLSWLQEELRLHCDAGAL